MWGWKTKLFLYHYVLIWFWVTTNLWKHVNESIEVWKHISQEVHLTLFIVLILALHNLNNHWVIGRSYSYWLHRNNSGPKLKIILWNFLVKYIVLYLSTHNANLGRCGIVMRLLTENKDFSFREKWKCLQSIEIWTPHT